MDDTTTIIEQSRTLRADLSDFPYPDPLAEITHRLAAWTHMYPQPDLVFLGWKLYLGLRMQAYQQLQVHLAEIELPPEIEELLGMHIILQPFAYHIGFGYSNTQVAVQTYLHQAYRAAPGDEVEAV